jgi:hypothetical protein
VDRALSELVSSGSFDFPTDLTQFIQPASIDIPVRCGARPASRN